MIDREKVIQGLQCCAIKKNCFGCPYCKGDDTCMDDKDKDALKLLKEQEAVEPYMDYNGHDVWRCGNCGAMIFHIEQSQADEDWKNYAKFCRQCGKKVKWE